MKTILISAYAVNPFKGSEDGMGWNYIFQASRCHKVIAITRLNNRTAIEHYMEKTRNDRAEEYNRITFLYFDWPRWTLFWKKGPMLSMIYYYVWQLSLACWLLWKRIDADVVHNLNFHNDWTPSFLWLLQKPFAWGPVGHHPRIPAGYIKVCKNGAQIKDSMLWLLKKAFWTFDPFLYLCRKKADMVWCMHNDALLRLGIREKYLLQPSVAAADVPEYPAKREHFVVLSVGRFVPLKGFDMTVRAFACFYRQLPAAQRATTELVLVGKGKYKTKLQEIAAEEGIEQAVKIRDWMTEAVLQQVYHEAAVFLYPSYEGAGMVVAEAMRCRLPVLCWNNEGPGNIVHPASRLKIAYSNYHQSVSQFAALLEDLFYQEDFYKEESLLARQRFEETLDWNLKAGQLSDFYQQTIIQHHRSKKSHEKKADCSSSAERPQREPPGFSPGVRSFAARLFYRIIYGNSFR